MTIGNEIRFVKLHGAANDYVCVDGTETPVDRPAELARLVCDRHRGIGADGLLVLERSELGDCRMLIFNADGSRAEMCGNGLRCLVKFAIDAGRVNDGASLRVETDAGVLAVEPRRNESGRISGSRIDLGPPRWDRADIPMAGEGETMEVAVDAGGRRWRLSAVSFGNPHAVIRVEDVDAIDIERFGPAIEKHALFPRGTNVEFVTPVGRQKILQRTWERGVGETLACGTGAAAVGVVAARLGWSDRTVAIDLRGGRLEVEWTSDDRVLLSGPAEEVCRGSFQRERLVGQ
ncbi:MAG: diaminopimelate epimerase [Planctomycetota bacterium]